MFGISVARAAEICGGRLIGSGDKNTEIKRIIIDSRSSREGDLFVAYKGEKVDGHDYIASALKKGAACALAEHGVEGADDGCVIIVTDVQVALEKLASAFRELVEIPVIGITGSVGKTTAKEMVSSVLSQHYKVRKTDKNLNNLIGLPMSLAGIERDDEIAVLEMGISGFGEMARLAKMARPDCALYTVIGHAHLEFLHDLNGVLKAKTEMLEYVPENGTVIMNGDDALQRGFECRQKKLLYGMSDGCDVMATNVHYNRDGNICCTISYGKESFSVEIPAFGMHMVYAALEGAAVGFTYGMTAEEIKRGIESFEAVGRRLAVTKTGFITLIDDTYNANPDSVKSSIDSLAHFEGRRVCVLGDMLELGENSPAMHRDVGAYAGNKGIDLVIGVGPLGKYIADGAGDNAVAFSDREQAEAELPKLLKAGDTVLVKASRGARLDEISEQLKKLKKPLVFLDIDDTVLDFKKAERIAVSEAFRLTGTEPDDYMLDRYSEVNKSFWEKLERGEITRAQLLPGRFNALYEELGIAGDGNNTQREYERLLGMGHYFMPGAEKLLEKLSENARLFLVSNGNIGVQKSRLASSGIEHYFEGIYISEEVGAEKPSVEFFDKVFDTIADFDRENSVIIGDSLTSDIKGGVNAGIKTIWYNYRGGKPREDIRPDYMVTSLDEIPELIENMF